MNTSELIYDWNKNHPPGLKPVGPVLLNDESLRDGLQSPSVRDPSIPEKIEILHLMEALGIDALDLGLPGAGARAVEHVTALAREIVAQKMKIRANCAARTHENDIRPIAEIVQKTGLRIEAATFIGSSPIRRFTEGWTDDFLLQTTEKAVKYAVSLGLDSMYVTEDTSRCDPETVKRLYSTAISCGARAIVICDTAGHATPMGAFALVKFVIEEVVKDSSGLAWAQRPRPGDCQLDGGADGGRALRSRLRYWNRRTRGQYADGPDAGESEADGDRSVG
jgi:2-isopropylmalate synthase